MHVACRCRKMSRHPLGGPRLDKSREAVRRATFWAGTCQDRSRTRPFPRSDPSRRPASCPSPSSTTSSPCRSPGLPVGPGDGAEVGCIQRGGNHERVRGECRPHLLARTIARALAVRVQSVVAQCNADAVGEIVHPFGAALTWIESDCAAARPVEAARSAAESIKPGNIRSIVSPPDHAAIWPLTIETRIYLSDNQ